MSKSDAGKVPGIVSYLLPGLMNQSGRLTYAVIAMLAGILLRIAEPWPLQFVIDQILMPMVDQGSGKLVPLQNGYTALALCAISLILITSIRAFCDYWTAVLFSLLGNRVVSDLRVQVYEHLQTLSLNFHQKSRAGDLTLRLVSDMNMLKDVTVTAALPLVSSVILLLGMFGYMIYLNWRLGLMVLAVLPMFYLLAIRKTKKIHQAANEQRKREGKLAATAAESIAAVKTVQAHSAHAAFSSVFAAQNKQSLKDGVKTGRLTASLERSVDVMIALASAIVLWQGTHFVFEGSLTAGGLIVYLTYLKRGFKPLQSFAKYTGRMSKALAAGERIVEVLNEVPAVIERPDSKPAPKLRGGVQLVDVSYAYPDGTKVFENLSLRIEPGERVAIIGPSGIGKSTLLNLLLRLQEPIHGSILLDGTNVNAWQVESVRKQFGVVLQENVLFAGTIADNVTLGNDRRSVGEILEALEIAQCHEFVERLPQQQNTFVGERGATLSQGQRQRIVLARSILRDNPIILLDEPTSNLDPQSKQSVLKAIAKSVMGRTMLMVTHDIDLALQMDKILFMDTGTTFFGLPSELNQFKPFQKFCGRTGVKESFDVVTA